MSNIEQVGARLVLENAAAFKAQLQAATDALQEFNDEQERAAGNSQRGPPRPSPPRPQLRLTLSRTQPTPRSTLRPGWLPPRTPRSCR